MDIYVSSKSEIKLNAALHAFSFLYPRENISIHGMSAPSLVNEQPRGREEIILGAQNRLSYCIRQCSEKYIISIENGLIYENEKFLDLAYVIISNPEGEIFSGWSKVVEFPLEQAKEVYFRDSSKTAGELMQETGMVNNHADPHVDLAGISREDILQKTIIHILKLHKKPD